MGRERARVGRNDRVEGFYRDHARDVYAFLLSLCREPDWADDLMQDTFLRATRSLRDYRGGSSRAWLLAIARTAFVDAARRRVPDPCDDLASDAWHDPDTPERLAVQGVLHQLPEAHRAALVLRDQLELDYVEVAYALDRSEGACRVLVHRARAAFRERYERLER